MSTPHIPPLPSVCPVQQDAASLLLLPKVRVGSSASVCTLRSQPVLNVGVTISFMPSEVAKAVYQCWEEVPTTLEAGNATVCLTIHKSSLDQLGECLPSGSSPLPHEGPHPILKREWTQESKYHLHIHPATNVGNLGPFSSPLPILRPQVLSPGYICPLLSTGPSHHPTLRPPLLYPTYTLKYSRVWFCSSHPLSIEKLRDRS